MGLGKKREERKNNKRLYKKSHIPTSITIQRKKNTGRRKKQNKLDMQETHPLFFLTFSLDFVSDDGDVLFLFLQSFPHRSLLFCFRFSVTRWRLETEEKQSEKTKVSRDFLSKLINQAVSAGKVSQR